MTIFFYSCTSLDFYSLSSSMNLRRISLLIYYQLALEWWSKAEFRILVSFFQFLVVNSGIPDPEQSLRITESTTFGAQNNPEVPHLNYFDFDCVFRFNPDVHFSIFLKEWNFWIAPPLYYSFSRILLVFRHQLQIIISCI